MEPEPFVGEIGLSALEFAPRGWAFCEGQVMTVRQNQVLFALLGTTFGGDGSTTFHLPDLRGRVPVGVDQAAGLPLGAAGGVDRVTLTVADLPAHAHTVRAGATADRAQPGGNLLAPATAGTPYRSPGGSGGVALRTLGAGAGQSHANRQPSIALRYCIALVGLFPPRP